MGIQLGKIASFSSFQHASISLSLCLAYFDMKDGFHLSAGRPNKPSMMTRKMGSRRELERNEEEEGDAALDRRRDPFRRWNAGGPGDPRPPKNTRIYPKEAGFPCSARG